MLYQKILTDEMPYQMRAGELGRFEEHRHAEIEFHYCLSGEVELTVDKKSCRVRQGELLVIGPMISHAVPRDGDSGQRVLTVIVGPSFLRRHFARFPRFGPAFVIFPHPRKIIGYSVPAC